MCRRVFMDKRMSQEVEGDSLGDEFKGYVFRYGWVGLVEVVALLEEMISRDSL